MGSLGGDNVLVTRFLADDTFSGLVDTAEQTLQTDLVDSGRAQEILDTWVAVLTDGASDLVDADTIQSEADAISAYFTAG
jgi:spore coat protein CotH